MKLHTNHINAEFYTERNKTILLMRSHGKPISEIANKINISSRRIESLIYEMRQMNNCVNESHLLCTALRKGIIE